jgi:hypothetical protein
MQVDRRPEVLRKSKSLPTARRVAGGGCGKIVARRGKVLALLFAVWFAPAFAAQQEESGGTAGLVRKAEGTAGNSEIVRNLVIAAGKSVSLDSEMDFSAAGSVAVTLRCTTCDSAANSMNKLVLQAFWSVPDAELYTVAESKAGSAFLYWDSGGAIFQVYGARFRLTIQNKGEQGMLVQQVVIFRRGP